MNGRPRRRISMKLAARPDGRFAKVVDGRYVYFGAGGDRDAALRELAEFIRLRDRDLGDAPAVPAGGATVGDAAAAFAVNLNTRLAANDLTPGSHADYKAAIEEFIGVVGAGVRIDDLLPGDFAAARSEWSSRLGPWALDRNVQAIRTMFRWSVRHRLCREPFYGDAFAKSAAGEKRTAARLRVTDRGERRFDAGELRKILRGLDGSLLAFVLLGINGGMYSKDVSDLRRQDVKRDNRTWIIDAFREKTDIRRRCPLWPETIKAIHAIPPRTARSPGDADRLFLTVHGRPWNRGSIDAINQEFTRRLAALGIHRPGVGFGALRHTHVSAVGDHPDFVAARFVRAHRVASIESHYDVPSLKRLLAVTNLARVRLLPPGCRAKPTTRGKAGCTVSRREKTAASTKTPRRPQRTT